MEVKDNRQIRPPWLDQKFHRLLTYSKIMSLTILSIYKEDGYPYKYLINDLGVMEGVAKPNIQYLEKKGFIVKIQEKKVENPIKSNDTETMIKKLTSKLIVLSNSLS